MSGQARDDARLIAQLRLTAPHSDDGYMLLRAANAIEDANARVALAHADALNAAAAVIEDLPCDDEVFRIGTYEWFQTFPAAWLRERAALVEMGEVVQS